MLFVSYVFCGCAATGCEQFGTLFVHVVFVVVSAYCVAVSAYCVAFVDFLLDDLPVHSAHDSANCELFGGWVAVIPVNAYDVVLVYLHLAVSTLAAIYF